MKLSEDQLTIFENQLRNTGLWCDLHGTDQLIHFMVCKNPKASIAISLCGTIITDIQKLHQNEVSQKCLPCSLYKDARKETKDKLFYALAALSQEFQTKQPNHKE